MAQRYSFGRFDVLPDERRVLDAGRPVALGSRAFDLLVAMIERRDRVVGKDELMAAVWPAMVVEEGNLTVQVSSLRKTLGADAITTVPGHGYRFTQDLIGSPARPAPGTTDAAIDLTLPDKPSIAVLPFRNISGDPEQAYFTDGITEDITTELSRFHSLFVTASTSAFTYKGEVRDVRTVGRELGVRHIVAAIAPEIETSELASSQRLRPDDFTAYQLGVRAVPVLSIHVGPRPRVAGRD